MNVRNYISQKTLEAYNDESWRHGVLYGQHLIYEHINKAVGVVFDMQNALVLSEEQKHFVWVAVCNASNIYALEILRGCKKVVLFPKDSIEYDAFNHYIYDNHLEERWQLAEPCKGWIEEQRTNLVLRNRYPDVFPEEAHPIPIKWNDYLEYWHNEYMRFEQDVMQPLIKKCGSRFAAYATLTGRCPLWDERLIWNDEIKAYEPR